MDEFELVFRQLDLYTSWVFEYEKNFLEFIGAADCDLLDIHFGSESIEIYLMDIVPGQHLTTSISTEQFRTWANGIKMFRFIEGENVNV